jgi:hypothetical protein
MKNIIPKDSRYIPFVQQQSCCAVACFLMVMYKRGIPLISQELLGYHLGLIVSPENKHLFWNVRTGKKPVAGYGTRVFSKFYEPNKVFKKLKIPLKFDTTCHIDCYKTEKQFREFIVDSVDKNKDMLACFDQGALNDNDNRAGHVCVLDRIYPKKGLVRIIDPSAGQPKWRLVKIGKLKKAMELHPANGGGFWELK